MNAAGKHRAPSDLNFLPVEVNMAPLIGGAKAEFPYCGKTLTLQTLRYMRKCGVQPGRPRITERALTVKAMACLLDTSDDGGELMGCQLVRGGASHEHRIVNTKTLSVHKIHNIQYAELYIIQTHQHMYETNT